MNRRPMTAHRREVLSSPLRDAKASSTAADLHPGRFCVRFEVHRCSTVNPTGSTVIQSAGH
jgi:hypothetical protein